MAKRKILEVDGPEQWEAQVRDEYRAWSGYNDMEKAAKSGKDEAAGRLLSLMHEHNADAVDLEGMRLSPAVNLNSRISKERLLERGIAPEIILFATIITKSKPWLRVSRLSEERKEGND